MLLQIEKNERKLKEINRYEIKVKYISERCKYLKEIHATKLNMKWMKHDTRF